MRTRLHDLAESLRASFWFLPVLMTVSAAALAYITLNIDDEFSGTVGGLLYNGGPDGARVLLSTVSASMVTVAATVFSITIVAMTLASQQFGPRMLTNFVRDRGNQATIGTFLAVFLYAVLVQRQVRMSPGRVPNISVSLAMVFAVAAVLVLIYFIHHIATSIQVMSLTRTISRDLHYRATRLFPNLDEFPEARPSDPDLFNPQGKEWHARPGYPGYVQSIDVERLLAIAAKHDLLLRLETRPGKFAVASTPLVTVWRRDGSGEDVGTDLLQDIVRAFRLGSRREHGQDAEFPMAQLTEVAVRALSPSLNDPFTGCACVNHLAAGLCDIAGEEMPPRALADSDGTTRLLMGAPITFHRLVREAYDPIRQSADYHVMVYLRLLEALTEIVLSAATADQYDALHEQADLVRERAGQVVPQQGDRQDVEARYEKFRDVLAAARVPG
ncbi:DUF2254 domain-containing protein [Nocardioides sp. GCM10027113]|uniref:DUF2254 domain-containing protein n=1 Tax=unclassified Nocardioides TaxID=2615069 RepID=UPI00362447A2